MMVIPLPVSKDTSASFAFRQFKAKKAKYGFDASVNHTNLFSIVQFVNDQLGEYPPDLWYCSMKMGNMAFKLTIYTNDDTLAENFGVLTKLMK